MIAPPADGVPDGGFGAGGVGGAEGPCEDEAQLGLGFKERCSVCWQLTDELSLGCGAESQVIQA